MQKINDRHGLPTIKRALRYIHIRCRSRPETTAMAGEFEGTRKEALAAEDRHEQAREERVAATAEIEYLDQMRDATVRNIVREVLVITGGRRDHPLYIKLFPESPALLMRPITDDKQERFVRTLTGMLHEDPALASLAPHAEALDNQTKALELAIKKREELYQPEARAEADLRVAVDKATRQYNLAHARLLVTFPRDPYLVESFFARLVPARDRGVDEVVPSDAPVSSEMGTVVTTDG